MSKKPRLCVQCRKLIGLDSVCPYCDANNANPLLRFKRSLAAQGQSLSLTALLIGVNVFVFLLTCVNGMEAATSAMEIAQPSGELVFRMGIQDNAAIAAGQWWRLITAMFIHLGVVHLFFNAYVLWMTGRYVEEEFGIRLMAVIYLLSGFLGFVASYAAGIGGGGASGAISGVMGAILARRWLLDGHFNHPMARYALMLTLLTVLFSAMPGVNHVAHGVGFVIGAGISALLSKVNLKRGGAIALLALSVLCVTVTVVALGAMLWSLSKGGPTDFMEARTCWVQADASRLQRYAGSVRELQEAKDCLEGVPSLEAPANEARDEAVRGLGAMIAAMKEFDGPARREGMRILEQALHSYVRWHGEAQPRYNPAYARR